MISIQSLRRVLSTTLNRSQTARTFFPIQETFTVTGGCGGLSEEDRETTRIRN
jgi:hypothetical protein